MEDHHKRSGCAKESGEHTVEVLIACGAEDSMTDSKRS